MIINYLKTNKIKVDGTLKHLIENSDFLTSIHPEWIDVLSKLYDFGLNGKGIRGVLIILGAEMYGKKVDENLLQIASAIELIHSSLLIHDDIMDQDELRRGFETIHYQYKKIGDKHNNSQANHYGISQGICVGDIGLYLAINIISKIQGISYEIKCKLTEIISGEITKTALAQMYDVGYGFGIKDPSLEDIEFVYLYKTGRYTYSLPLMLGGIYAGKDLEDLKIQEQFGEKMGVVFQIVDDYLGLFADEKELGKSVGSDIRENKKTYIRKILFDRSDRNDLNVLNNIFGSKNVNNSDIDIVRKFVKKYEVDSFIKDLVNKISLEASDLINKMEVEDNFKNILYSLVEYNKDRTK